MTRINEAIDKQLPQSLRLFRLLLLLFTGLSVATTFGLRFRHHGFAPFEPLFPPLPFFDFYIFLDRMHLVHHASFFGSWGYPWMYPAPAAPLYAFLYEFCFGGNWLWGWLLLAFLTIGACLFAMTRLVRFRPARGIRSFYLLTLFCSWPIYISLQRGNIESLLWLVLAAGIWQFVRGHYTSAGLLIGLAGAFKIYPILCLALFIPQRRWKDGILGIGTMVAVTIGSLWFINPDLGYAYRHVSEGVKEFTLLFASSVEPGQGIFDHSAFELFKFAVRPPASSVQHWMHLYFVTAGCVMLLLFFSRVLKLPLTNQVLFLIVAGVFLPPASFDYTLQSLYIPFALVVLGALTLPMSRTRSLLMAAFAMEFAPLTFIQHHGTTANGVVKALGLLALLLIAVTKPIDLPSRAAFIRVENH